MTRKLISAIIFLSFFISLQGQTVSAKKAWLIEVKGGIKLQKAQKLYWENGFSIDLSSQKILDRRLHIEASYVTSRLGSAMGSNAIKQDNFVLSGSYHFRHKNQLQPVIKLNTGYFHADYEEDIFDVLPNSAFLLSLDAGLSYEFNFPLTVNLCAGYNINYGKGISGPGTLYPIYYQMSIYYTILKQK